MHCEVASQNGPIFQGSTGPCIWCRTGGAGAV